jgi:hypothetical protein
VDTLRQYVLRKYVDVYAKRKVINFSKAFFRYLSQTRFDTRYQAFELFLELPKALKDVSTLPLESSPSKISKTCSPLSSKLLREKK